MDIEHGGEAALHDTSAMHLSVKTDAELAQWQSGWKTHTADWILADREWQRRVNLRQLNQQYQFDMRLAAATERANKFTMICIVIATLIGALIGGAATLFGSFLQNNPLQFQAPQQASMQQSTHSAESPRAAASR